MTFRDHCWSVILTSCQGRQTVAAGADTVHTLLQDSLGAGEGMSAAEGTRLDQPGDNPGAVADNRGCNPERQGCSQEEGEGTGNPTMCPGRSPWCRVGGSLGKVHPSQALGRSNRGAEEGWRGRHHGT